MRFLAAMLLLLSCLPARAELTCAQLGAVSQRTVERNWAKARLLLHDALENPPLSGSGA